MAQEEKPFYIRQLPKEAQDWLKNKAYKSFIADGDKEEDAQKKAEDFLDEKVYTAEEMYGKDFLKEIGKTEEPKKKRIRATDYPDWVWDDEKVVKRFMATPYLYGNYSKDMSDKDKEELKKDYQSYKNAKLDDLMKSKDFEPFYEYVEDEEDVKPNNYTSKSLWGEGEGNQFADLDKLLDEWDKEDIDTNDNGEIEVDEMADFQKSLDDYAAKNKRGRDDIPVATRR